MDTTAVAGVAWSPIRSKRSAVAGNRHSTVDHVHGDDPLDEFGWRGTNNSQQHPINSIRR